MGKVREVELSSSPPSVRRGGGGILSGVCRVHPLRSTVKLKTSGSRVFSGARLSVCVLTSSVGPDIETEEVPETKRKDLQKTRSP